MLKAYHSNITRIAAVLADAFCKSLSGGDQHFEKEHCRNYGSSIGVLQKMAGLSASYGSELHLLRMLGRHRSYFDRKVLDVTGADSIEWRDFPSGARREDTAGNVYWDREWQQVAFLDPGDYGRTAWNAAWPSRGTGPNWDAVGVLRYGVAQEWLLVEAKANVQELLSECGAKDAHSIKLIRGTLDQTKAALDVPATVDWMQPYYQFCNRLAVLHVMNKARSPARLLYVYFCGDVGNSGRTCPPSQAEWTEPLRSQERQVGLRADHGLKDRIHKCFIDVQCVA
jgi:hypothetical protein